MIKKAVIGILLLSLIWPALLWAQENPDSSKPQTAAPPKIKATLFPYAGSGGAYTRTTFKWEDPDLHRPLDGVPIGATGNCPVAGLTGWFYPAESQNFFLVADLAFGATDTKAHFSGDGQEFADKKMVSFYFAQILGGAGYRQWVGAKQRYSLSYYLEAGPGIAQMEMEDFIKDVDLSGVAFLGGVGFSFHYSTRIIFGVMAEIGYGFYLSSAESLENDWNGRGEKVTVTQEASTARARIFLGYEF